MRQPPNDEEALTRFFLGRCNETERTQIEERYFQDEALFEVLESHEAKLIDDYLARRLPPADAAAFERHYLSSTRRQRKVESARLLRDGIRRTHSAGTSPWSRIRGFLPEPRRALQFGVAALLLLLVTTAATYYLILRSGPPVYVLAEGAVKSDIASIVQIPISSKGPSKARLRLDLSSPTAHESRRVALRPMGEKKVVWSKDVSIQSGLPVLDVEIDFGNIPGNDYLLTLETDSGTTTSSYVFRMTRK